MSKSFKFSGSYEDQWDALFSAAMARGHTREQAILIADDELENRRTKRQRSHDPIESFAND